MKKRKKINLALVLVLAGSLIIGGLCGLMVARVALDRSTDFGGYMLTMFGLLLGLYVVLFAHIAIHEAGHLIFGLLTGYGFSSYRLGSFMWLMEDGKLRFRRLSIPGTGGQCLMTPPDIVEGKIPYVLYNLGGCILNTVTALIALVLWLVLPKDSVISVLLAMTALFGLILAASNGIPMRMGGVDNDGRNALMLGKHPKAMRAFWLQLKVNEQLARGIRLKDMPEEWFAAPRQEDMDNSMIAAQAVFGVNRLMDEGRLTEARDRMEELLRQDSAMIGLHRNLLVCDLVFCELTGENRPEKISELLTKEQRKFMQAMRKYLSVLRTGYALALLAEKDMEKAKKLLEQFEKAAKSYPYPCEVRSEWELIELAGIVWTQRSGQAVD